jgi:hypothetical protein
MVDTFHVGEAFVVFTPLQEKALSLSYRNYRQIDFSRSLEFLVSPFPAKLSF